MVFSLAEIENSTMMKMTLTADSDADFWQCRKAHVLTP